MTGKGSCIACDKGKTTALPGIVAGSSCYVDHAQNCQSGRASKYYVLKQGLRVPSAAVLDKLRPTMVLKFRNADGFKQIKGMPCEGKPTRCIDFASSHVTYMKAEKSGNHTFWTESTGGSQLFVDGVKILDNPGAGNSAPISATSVLVAGLYYTVEVRFSHEGRGASLLALI